MRLGKIVAALYVAALVPRVVRRNFKRPDSDVPFTEAFDFLIKSIEGAIVTKSVNKLIGWLISAAKRGLDGFDDLQDFIKNVRMIAPLTGKVYLPELLQMTIRAEVFFIPMILVASKYLKRQRQKKRARKDNVYGRVRAPSKMEETFDEIKQQLGL